MMQRIRTKMMQDEGFTLIELLIVIVILGILAAVVVFAVNGITNKGTTAACQSDKKSVQVASEAYFAQNGQYAPAVAGQAPYLIQANNQGFLQNWPSSTSYTITYTGGGGTTPPTISSTLSGC